MSDRIPSREFWTQTALERTTWISAPPVESAEARDAIQALDEELDAIAYALASVRTRRNALVRAAILPPEVLARIFEIVRDLDPIRYKSLGWFRVLRVCGYWRRVAVQHAALWSKLTLNVVDSGLWTTFRTRAANSLLDVCLHSGRYMRSSSLDWDTYSEAVTVFSEVVAESAPLVRTLQLQASLGEFYERDADNNVISQPSFFAALLPLLRNSADQLKALVLVAEPQMRINGQGTDRHLLNTLSEHVIRFITHHTPNVEYVRLCGFQFPWNAYGNLSHLRCLKLSPVRYSEEPERNVDYNLKTLIEYLRHAPQLEELDLDASIPLPHPTAAEELPVLLPHLTTLRLAGLGITCIALWRLLRIHADARAAITLRGLDNTFDFSSISSCLETHIPSDGCIYDVLQLSALALTRGEVDVPAIFIELYDKSRRLYRGRSIYSYDPAVGLRPSHHPRFHLGLLPARQHNAFPEGGSDIDSDLTDTNIDPAPPFRPRRAQGMYRRGPLILKRALAGVDMSRLRTLTLVTRVDQGCPWTAQFLRPLLRRATALEHIRLDVTMRDPIVSLANGLKPNADATRPPPAPVLKTLHIRDAIFNWPGATGEEPQSAIFNDMLERRAQSHLGPQKLKLRNCRVDGTWVARWRAQIEKVIWDRDETNQVGEVGDETSDWAASDEEYVSSTLRSREDEEDDW